MLECHMRPSIDPGGMAHADLAFFSLGLEFGTRISKNTKRKQILAQTSAFIFITETVDKHFIFFAFHKGFSDKGF